METNFNVNFRIGPVKFDNAYYKDYDDYAADYEESIEDPESFWKRNAEALVDWSKPFTKVLTGSFTEGSFEWFEDGELNVCYNCVDRHLPEKAEYPALILEADNPSDNKIISYGELFVHVNKFANHLKNVVGISRGDIVVMYMQNSLEAVYTMLALARIGAVHNVVFAGFSAESLAQRIFDSGARFVITQTEGSRRGKTTNLLKNVLLAAKDESLEQSLGISAVVFAFPNIPEESIEGSKLRFFPIDSRTFFNQKDTYLEIRDKGYFVEPEPMRSEDMLFILYTSGSTGKPKGLVHTTGGYLVGAALTHRVVFNYHEGDVFACMADIGWITGHTYIVYGPLANGATTLIFASTPDYPDLDRYWQVIDRNSVTQFYTAPTAIRYVMKAERQKDFDLGSLRVIGSVGEPINEKAWDWYYNEIGKSRSCLVDTYWQTETGSIILTALPNVVPLKKSAAAIPFFGVAPQVLNHEGEIIEGDPAEGVLVLETPIPSMARTIFGDHKRFVSTYLSVYPGYYFTGDSVYRDYEGYYFIKGRVDDVLNVAGHRLGTSEIESAMSSHGRVAECAAVGVPHELTGESIFVYVVARGNLDEESIAEEIDIRTELARELKALVSIKISPIAVPKSIVFVRDLPKTRSGKIMRRLLRKIASGVFDVESLGDLTTLAEVTLIDSLIKEVMRERGMV